MGERELKELIDKYLAETATPEEEKTLIDWYHEQNNSEAIVEFSSEMEKEQLFIRVRNKLEIYTDASEMRGASHHFIKKWVYRSVAAAIVLLFAVGGYKYYTNFKSNAKMAVNIASKEDVMPGGNKAVLTLADGSTVVLSDAQNGQIAQQGSAVIKKTADGQVVYTNVANTQALSPIALNTVVTPRGGQYHLILSDGTQVWLNAASSISYPVAFSGKTREVAVSGEAYFKVVHNAAQPFRVKAGNRIIEDIGTTFNVNAYSDESDVKTTLLEGAVKMDGTLLHPGEQAKESSRGNIQVSRVDVQQIVAWQKGMFEFDNTTLSTIMRQISRWYDIDVVYQNPPDNDVFGGGINKNQPLSSVLNLLESNGVRFKLQGKTLFVNP